MSGKNANIFTMHFHILALQGKNGLCDILLFTSLLRAPTHLSMPMSVWQSRWWKHLRTLFIGFPFLFSVRTCGCCPNEGTAEERSCLPKPMALSVSGVQEIEPKSKDQSRETMGTQHWFPGQIASKLSATRKHPVFASLELLSYSS